MVVAITGCKKDFEGEADINKTIPETYLVVDSIYRSGDTRYTTTIQAHWWGSIQSGYIKGYEVSIDNQQTWQFTTKQADVFLLTIPFGSDTANIKIFVRAINQNGIADPTPAGLTFPVRNTPPVIEFDFSAGQKITSFPAFRLSWVPRDIDGEGDISNIQIAFNDTNNLVSLPANVTATSFVGERVNGTFTGSYQLFNNTQTLPFAQKASGGVFNDTNTIYLRCVDRSGSPSQWVSTKLYIRRPQNGILFITDYVSNSNKNITTNFYSNRINNLGASYTNFDVVRSLLDELPSDAFTTAKAFEFFNRIVWVSDDPTRTLGTAQLATVNFFNNGGKVFFVLEIPNDVALDASFFSFTPIEKLIDNPGRSFRMATGDQLFPYNATWPVLKATGIVTFPRPFQTYTTSTGLFTFDSLARADLISFGPGGAPKWTGPSNVMAKRYSTQKGKNDMVVLTVPLHLLNGNNNVDSFFRQVTVGELEF